MDYRKHQDFFLILIMFTASLFFEDKIRSLFNYGLVLNVVVTVAIAVAIQWIYLWLGKLDKRKDEKNQ